MSFFDEIQSGRIISRINSDTQEFSQVVVLVTDLISQLMLVAILIVALFTVSWQLTLMLLALGFRRVARFVTRSGFRAIMVQGGHYAALYDTYFRHQSPDYRVPSLSH